MVGVGGWTLETRAAKRHQTMMAPKMNGGSGIVRGNRDDEGNYREMKWGKRMMKMRGDEVKE